MLRILFRHFSVSVFLILLFWPKNAFAIQAPTLVSPLDNSKTGSSPKLSWEFSDQCADSGSCFRVEVDNNEDFKSNEKQAYSNSLDYSPRDLGEGQYFWRVKAKGVDQKWSDWSKVYKFIVSDTEDQVEENSEAKEESKSEDEFKISNLSSEINSDQEVEADISLRLKDKANSVFYLKGAFRKDDSINYLGETYSGSSWAKNNSSYSQQLKIQTNNAGFWEGKIKVKPDQNDSGFKGSGEYKFKVGRYTDTGNGPVWSNELTLKINEIVIQTPTPTPEPSADIESEEEEVEGEISEESSPIPYPSFNYDYLIASVAGEATKSDNITLEEHTRVLEEKRINWLLVTLGLGILILGGGYAVYKVEVPDRR